MSGTVQFLRACSLQVVGDDGAGLDLSELRVKFQVTHGTVQTPCIMQARVYNPDPATVTAIQSQFTRVILSAGYQGNVAQIFSGTIAQTRYGRENPTDTFIDIFGTTNEQSYATATTMQVLAAGWTHQDVRDQCVKDMATDQIAAGAFPELAGSGARPKVMCGMTRDMLRTTATSAASVWNVDDTTLHFTRVADMANAGGASAIALTPASGLVGIPVQVPGGVQATCLLNPALKPGAPVTIHTGDVLASQADLVVPNGFMSLGLGEDWDLTKITDLSPAGGHAIWICGYNADGLLFNTWGTRTFMPWATFMRIADEAYGLLSRENWLTIRSLSPNNENFDQLLAEVRAA